MLDRPALDEVVQMMGGLAYMTGLPDRPLRVGSSVNDIMGGMFGAIGALAQGIGGALLTPGDHVVVPSDAYGGTYRLFNKVLSTWGVEHTIARIADAAAITYDRELDYSLEEHSASLLKEIDALVKRLTLGERLVPPALAWRRCGIRRSRART